MRVRNPNTGKTFFSKQRRRFDSERSARSLTFSYYRRFQFLSKDRTRNWFVEALSTDREKFPVALWAWVIMPEHVHLLVCPGELEVVIGRFCDRSFSGIRERACCPAGHCVAGAEFAQLDREDHSQVGKRTRRRF